MTTRIPRNAKKVFYATESTTRTKPDGEVIRVAGREQRSTTFAEARRFLDDLGVSGGVTLWTARSQQTNAYADRRADGTWVSLDRLTGTWEPLPDLPSTDSGAWKCPDCDTSNTRRADAVCLGCDRPRPDSRVRINLP
ncbi:hypothetical protein [Streptomyces sp. NPDC006863]|uniref:hypothetical protein n=1 Tax=Streptomyces sp. NPDC006863 TaxID=3154779 RepID=UPI0033C8A731